MQRPDDTGIKHRPRLGADLKGHGADFFDDGFGSAQQPDAGADGAVFVEPGRADIDAELQRFRLLENGRADTGATGVIDHHLGAGVMGEADNALDILDVEDLIAHREAGQGHHLDVFGLFKGALKIANGQGVDKVGPGIGRAAHDTGVAAGRGNPDDRTSRFGQHPHRRHHRRRLTVHGHDVMHVGIAAEMIQRQFRQPSRQQRRGQFVIHGGEIGLLIGRLVAAFQTRQVIDFLHPLFLGAGFDKPPGVMQLGVVIAAVADDVAVRIGQAGRVGIAVAVFCHVGI